MTQARIDRIEEFFNHKEQNMIGLSTKQLFTADDDDIDFKTETDLREIGIIERLYFFDTILQKRGLKPLYFRLYNKRLRLKISNERGSRKEFVKINTKGEDPEETVNKLGSLNSIFNSRK